jgi:DNA invertase Pin-like site-specific DNA recombinase
MKAMKSSGTGSQALIYARSKDFKSIVTQLAACRRHLRKLGHTESRPPIIDTSSAQGMGRRLGWLVAEAANGQRADRITLVVGDVTRLCRSTCALPRLRSKLETAGIDVVVAESVNRHDDTAEGGDDIYRVYLQELLTAYWCLHIGEATKRGIAAKRERDAAQRSARAVSSPHKPPARRGRRASDPNSSGGP